jgi:hypothetical protein
VSDVVARDDASLSIVVLAEDGCPCSARGNKSIRPPAHGTASAMRQPSGPLCGAKDGVGRHAQRAYSS